MKDGGDEQRALDDLVSWVKSHGGVCSQHIRLVRDDDGSSKGITTGTLPAGEAFMSCPHSLIYDWDKAISLIPESLKHSILNRTPSTEHPIWVFGLAAESLKGESSFFYPYIRILPSVEKLAGGGFLHGEDWGEAVKGTNLEPNLEDRLSTWKEEWNWVVECCNREGGQWPEVASKLTWELFLWAAVVFTSRAFPDSLMKPDSPSASPTREREEAEVSRPMLVPLVDMLNHKPYSQIVWLKEPNNLTLQSVNPTPAGQELFNNYGPKSNAELLIGYGFCIPNNPFDTFQLKFNPPLMPRQKLIRDKQRATFLKNEIIKDNVYHLYIPSAADAQLPTRTLCAFPQSLMTLVQLLVCNRRELVYLTNNPTTNPISLRNSIARDTQLLAAIQKRIPLYTSRPTPKNNIQRTIDIHLESQLSILRYAQDELVHALQLVTTPVGRAQVKAIALEELLASDEPFRDAIGASFGAEDAETLRESGTGEAVFALGISRKLHLYNTDRKSPYLSSEWCNWLEKRIFQLFPYPFKPSKTLLEDINWKQCEQRRNGSAKWVWEDVLDEGRDSGCFSKKDGWTLGLVMWGIRVWEEESWKVGDLEGIELAWE